MIGVFRTAFSEKNPEKSNGCSGKDSYATSKDNLNRLMKSLRSGKLKDHGSSKKVVVFGRSQL